MTLSIHGVVEALCGWVALPNLSIMSFPLGVRLRGMVILELLLLIIELVDSLI